jgi:TRAP-type mannitol/chloroaromatic compound transport system substrate-binding protein
MHGKIFISYRREDARADARSIFQRLEHSFGAQQLFMDVDSIPTGSDFRRLLDQHLKQCQVMLVVIGPKWLDCVDEDGQRRLHDPSDFVRLEVATALRHKIAVIPVLVDGARPPKRKELPHDLQPLVDRQAASVRHETFARDLDVLEQDIQAIFKHRTRRLRAGAGTAAIATLAGLVMLFWFWPQIGSLLGGGRTGPSASSMPAISGVSNVTLANWQKEVRPAVFKVEESPNVGRPNSIGDRLKNVSKGMLQLEIAPVGSSVKPSDRLEALSKGTLDAVWETPTYWGQKTRALTLHSGQVPLGLDNRRFVSWVLARGARELDAIYQDRLGLKVKSILCRLLPAEGMWFKKPVSVPNDLKGALIRSSSFFMTRVAPKLGFKTVSIPASEVVGALERGGLDGAEVGEPQADYERGLHKAAKHYYYPSFHAPSLAAHLVFNLDRWNALDAPARGLIEEACRAQVEADLKSNDALVQRALVRLRTEGVQIHTFSAEILAAVDRATQEVAEELSASDPDFKRAYASYNAFR